MVRKTRDTLTASILALVVAALPAHAGDGDQVSLQVKIPDRTDARQRGKAPSIEATVIGVPKLPPEKYTISAQVGAQKVTLKAERLREYIDGDEPIAIALVFCGQEIWIGNDDYEQDENAKYAGVLKNLAQAIDKLQLGNVVPPNSKGIVISYSTGAEIKVPMGDLKQITGAALGGQRDYHRKIGNDLSQGISTAMAELQKTSTARKALIVVGDGNDTNNEVAKAALALHKKDAAKLNIETFAIIYRGPMSTDGAVITTMVPGTKTVNSYDGIAAELSNIMAHLTGRIYLTFPGYVAATKQGLPWDGKEHEIVIKVDQTELDPQLLTLAPRWSPPKTGGFPWLVVILVVLGTIMLIVIGVKLLGSNRVEAPMPMAMPMPMVAGPASAAPKSASPMKTVMIGAGGHQEGFPIVGWIVALNGQDAYRTQRLKPGLTKIGTALPADIVVNDGFMSTEHCQITCSPSGFALIDNGATNGCYVNDRKVQKHDLVDNDVITLGKTNFKFKSIN